MHVLQTLGLQGRYVDENLIRLTTHHDVQTLVMMYNYYGCLKRPVFITPSIS